MAIRILTAAALCVALAGPALAGASMNYENWKRQRTEIAAEILRKEHPECSKPAGELTVQQQRDCRDRLDEIYDLARDAQRLMAR